MNFDEWKATTNITFTAAEDEISRAAWRAAAEAEREQCAKEVENSARTMRNYAEFNRAEGNEANAFQCLSTALQLDLAADNIRARSAVCYTVYSRGNT